MDGFVRRPDPFYQSYLARSQEDSNPSGFNRRNIVNVDDFFVAILENA